MRVIKIAYSAPTNLYYMQGTTAVTEATFQFYVTIPTASRLKPSVTGTVTHYTISPALPKGLSMAETTGIITGKPTQTIVPTLYVALSICSNV